MRHVGTTPAGHEIVSCAICDSVDVRELYIKFDVPLVECRRCGLVFVSPRPPREIVFQRYNPRYFDEEYLPAHGVVMCHPGFVDDVLIGLDPLTTTREIEHAYLASDAFPRLLAENDFTLD